MLKVNPLDILSYYSQTFSIVVEWDGGVYYTINVKDEKKATTVETVKVELLQQELFLKEFRKIDIVVERLKTKYIMDYEHRLNGYSVL